MKNETRELFHEMAYLELLYRAKEKGIEKPDRTDVGYSKSLFAQTLTFDLSKGVLPLMTHRPTSARIAFEEMMFFLRGETDTTKLEEKDIFIWSGNTTREFLDSRGLTHLPVGDFGKSYGYQWRNYNGNEDKKGVDQLLELLCGMKDDPYSRRHIINAWNPSQIDEMALPPCHMMQLYSITPDGYLHSSWIQRSADILFGVPYNILMYSMLNIIFAKYLGLKSGTVTGFFHDAHVYRNQEVVVDELKSHEINYFPWIKIKKELNTIDDILSLEFSDLDIRDYNPDRSEITKVPMAV